MIPPAKSDAEESSPFDAGPGQWIANAVRFQFVARTAAARAAIVLAVGWLPLIVLTALRGSGVARHPHDVLLLDLHAHARYLIATPMFVIAAAVYLPQLGWAVHTFLDAGIIARIDLPRYHALVASTRRLLASRITDAVIVALAYLVTWRGPILSLEASTWAISSTGQLSVAGWWQQLVSQPLFLSLAGVWLWRVALWGRFLWTVARLNLRLVAGHPDRLGGLRFILIPLRGFAFLAFAVGAIGAATVGEAIIFDGRMASEFRYFIATHVLTVLAVFVGPLIPLSIPLLRLQAHGTIGYGRLASNLGRQFERRWIDAGRREVDPDTLAASDFSATTDLFSIVANAQSINPLILEVRDIAMLVVATLLPYLPIVFAVFPVEELVKLAMQAVI
jgi:hypothetical protein